MNELMVVDEPQDSRLATTIRALTPKKRREVLQTLEDYTTQEDEIKRYAWTLSSLARRVRMHPATFSSVLHDAAKSPSHKLHSFALDVFEHWGRREEWLINKGLHAAEHKNDFAGFVTMLERSHEGWEQSKHRKETPTVINNFGQMLIAAQQARGSLRPGD